MRGNFETDQIRSLRKKINLQSGKSISADSLLPPTIFKQNAAQHTKKNKQKCKRLDSGTDTDK